MALAFVVCGCDDGESTQTPQPLDSMVSIDQMPSPDSAPSYDAAVADASDVAETDSAAIPIVVDSGLEDVFSEVFDSSADAFVIQDAEPLSSDEGLPPPPAPDSAIVMDSDGDGIPDGDDNCPELSNPDQTDEDVTAWADAAIVTLCGRTQTEMGSPTTPTTVPTRQIQTKPTMTSMGWATFVMRPTRSTPTSTRCPTQWTIARMSLIHVKRTRMEMELETYAIKETLPLTPMKMVSPTCGTTA